MCEIQHKIPNLLSKYNSYYSAFTAEYTKICKKGELITSRHNYARNKLAPLINVITHSNNIKILILLPLRKNNTPNDKLRLAGDTSTNSKITVIDMERNYPYCK